MSNGVITNDQAVATPKSVHAAPIREANCGVNTELPMAMAALKKPRDRIPTVISSITCGVTVQNWESVCRTRPIRTELVVDADRRCLSNACGTDNIPSLIGCSPDDGPRTDDRCPEDIKPLRAKGD